MIDTSILVKWRRDLHQIPEKSLLEVKTAAYIRKQLEDMGIEYTKMGVTGTIVKFDTGTDYTVAFRADIDGLEIEEQNKVDYASTHKGVMHACGHDGHITILLGFAKYLQEYREKLKNNIVLIFQPAEEGPGGANVLISEGLFEKFPINHIYGLHLWPDIKEGVFASREGALMSSNAELEIHITGKRSHGAIPHHGIDAIMIASELIQEYQTILSRRMSPLSHYVINIGKINGGDAENVVAETVHMIGSVRTFNEKDLELLDNHFRTIHKGKEIATGCKIDWRLDARYPPVINEKQTYQTVLKALEKEELPFEHLSTPWMPSEDFAYYQQKVPGTFMFLGTLNEEKGFNISLHNGHFDFNDEFILKRGIEGFIAIAKQEKCL